MDLSFRGSTVANPSCNKTILSGEIQQDGLDTNNSYHVVTTYGVSAATVVDGFCISGGYAVYMILLRVAYPHSEI